MDQKTTSQSGSGPLHLVWRLTILTLALVVAVGPTSEACVERIYSRGVYPIIQQVFTSLSNQVPVALFDFLVIGSVVALIAKCITTLRRSSMVRRPVIVLVLVREIAVVMALVYLVFMLSWGFNYRRESLESKLDFDTNRITPASLEALARESVVQLNQLHGLAQARPWPTLESVPKVLVKPFRYAQGQLPAAAEPQLARPKTHGLIFISVRLPSMVLLIRSSSRRSLIPTFCLLNARLSFFMNGLILQDTLMRLKLVSSLGWLLNQAMLRCSTALGCSSTHT